MKKLVALVTSLLMVSLIFTGCSSDELAYYQTIKSVNAMTNYTCSGSFAVKFNEFKANPSATSNSGISSSDMKLAKLLLNNATIDYSGTVDSTKNKVTFDLKVKSGDNSISNSFDFILDNGNDGSLLDISPIVASAIPSQYKYTDVTINKIEYYQYDLNQIIKQLNSETVSKPDMTNPYSESTQKTSYDAYANLFNLGYSDGYNGQKNNSSTFSGNSQSYTDGYNQGLANAYAEKPKKSIISSLTNLTTITKTTSVQKDLQNKVLSLSDSFMNDYFSNLSLGIVKKTASDTYSYNASFTDISSALNSIVEYVGKNPSQLKTMLVSFANSLTDSEVQMLGFSDITTTSGLVKAINDLPLSDVSTSLKSLTSAEKALVGKISMNLNYTLKKTDTNAYSISDSLSFNNDKETDANYFIDFSVAEKSQITGS